MRTRCRAVSRSRYESSGWREGRLRLPRSAPHGDQNSYLSFGSAAVFLQYFPELHRRAALVLALVGRFHERENLHRLLRRHRRHSGLEEPHDFNHQRRIAIKQPGRGLAFFTLDQAVKTLVLAEDAFAAAGPGADDLHSTVRRHPALDRLAARAENRIERFHTVDAIPEQVGVVWLAFARAAGFGIN